MHIVLQVANELPVHVSKIQYLGDRESIFVFGLRLDFMSFIKN